MTKVLAQVIFQGLFLAPLVWQVVVRWPLSCANKTAALGSRGAVQIIRACSSSKEQRKLHGRYRSAYDYVFRRYHSFYVCIGAFTASNKLKLQYISC